MVGWHHRLNRHGFGWTPGVGDGQGGLACCGSWGSNESEMTEQLTQTELNGETDKMIRLMDLRIGKEWVSCMERVTWKLTLLYVN